jgi:hypothetical protein
MTTINVKTPKGSTKVSEGGYGYGGGVRVYKSKVKKIKSKYYQTQYETADKDYGHPTIKNIFFKSKMRIPKIEKRLNTQRSGYLQTFKIGKDKYQKAIKAKKIKINEGPF